MKSVESSRLRDPEKEWAPSTFADPRAAASPGAIHFQDGESDSPEAPLPQAERSRVFLHQLSQNLTSLRGILELALLVASDEKEYKAALQQSLAQAEGLVQIFKSYRTSAESRSADGSAAPVALGELISMVIEQLRPISVSRQLNVRVNLIRECVVQADAAGLLVALRQGVLRAIQRTATGKQIDLTLSASEGLACLVISASTPAAENSSSPPLVELSEPTFTATFAVDNVKGDWRPVRRAIEALGGTVLTPVEPSPVFCKICLPLLRPEAS